MAIELTTASAETLNNIRLALNAIGYTEATVLSAKGDITTGWNDQGGGSAGRFIQDCINGTTSMRWYNIMDGDHAELIRAYTGNADEGNNLERAQIATDWTDLSASGITLRAFNNDPENFKEYDFKFTGEGELRFVDANNNNTQYSTVVSHILSSGDGFGYTTLELQPDATRTQYDQYLIIDPTAPNHIHIRAGGLQDNSNAQLFLGGEDTHFSVGQGTNPTAYIRSTYNVNIQAVNPGVDEFDWYYNNDGTIGFPNLPSNNRTGIGNTFKFALQGNQHIIASPKGTLSNPTVQRLVIAGGDSYQDPDTDVWTGEGGDIYLWAGYGADGGDIKIDAGNGHSAGGSIKVRGGSATNAITEGCNGGFVEIQAGPGWNGANTSIYGGYGVNNGGSVNIISGNGTTGSGDINITAASQGIKGKINLTANNTSIRYTGSVPGTSVGASGDVAGDFALSNSYIYFCTGNYDGTTDIWKRLAWSNDTW